MDKPKDKNMTVRITEQLRTEIDALREIHFPEVQINSFLAYLVRIGLEEEKLRFEEDRLRKESRLKNAARLEPSPVRDVMPVAEKNELTEQAITERLNQFNLGDEVVLYSKNPLNASKYKVIDKDGRNVIISNSGNHKPVFSLRLIYKRRIRKSL